MCYGHIEPLRSDRGRREPICYFVNLDYLLLNDLRDRSHDTCRSRLPTSQTDVFEVGKNDRLLCKHLDLVEENRDVASVKLANYQQNISQGYNKGIKNKEFIPGDFVLKKILGNTRDLALGKLGPT